MRNRNEDRANVVIEGTAVEALDKGFRDLMDLCDVVTDKFEEARAEYHDKGNTMEV